MKPAPLHDTVQRGYVEPAPTDGPAEHFHSLDADIYRFACVDGLEMGQPVRFPVEYAYLDALELGDAWHQSRNLTCGNTSSNCLPVTRMYRTIGLIS